MQRQTEGRIVELRDENRKERERQRFREDQEEERPANVLDGDRAHGAAFARKIERESRRHLRSVSVPAPGTGAELGDGGIDATVEAADSAEEIAGKRAPEISARDASEEFIDGVHGRLEGRREQQSHQLERHQHRDHQHRKNIEHDVAKQLLDDVGALAQMQPAELTLFSVEGGGSVEVLADVRGALAAVPGR